MIHIVMGGALSGKTTYVRKKYLNGDFEVNRIEGIPYSQRGNTFVIGDYSKETRTCGVDQLGRSGQVAHTKVLAFLENFGKNRRYTAVAEGTILHRDVFFEQLIGQPVKLIYLHPSIAVIAQRAKELNIKWLDILTMSHKVAAKMFLKWKKEFDYEIIEG